MGWDERGRNLIVAPSISRLIREQTFHPSIGKGTGVMDSGVGTMESGIAIYRIKHAEGARVIEQ